MPVIAIIGAGPGLGRAIAKTFGDQGHTVALLSRTPAKLEPVVAELGDQGIQAAAFAADVLDRSSITSGLTAVKQRFGPVDVLEYSPANAQLPTAPATELTHDNVQIQLDFYAHGAVAAVNQVLPDMLERGSGTILFTTGASSIYPELGHEMFANVAAATAWLRNWAHGLHAALTPRGVQVGHVAIAAWIGQPGATPEAIAPLYWQLHTQHDQVEKVFSPQTPQSQPSPDRPGS
jgi:NAD(P)-dependent dehydrogenase (short-subunit alcohol dehydrogenase family)